MVLTYLMRQRRMRLVDAYRLLKTARPSVRPNPGFMVRCCICSLSAHVPADVSRACQAQLIALEHELFGDASLSLDEYARMK